ncbi:periplasmic binding protein/LacI transcriptional regulator [Candidatus Vecturithrix granuli]|uniref:Periplasmic binding protein/LacI transcriptional regulator n=1 Tax=Vecturithrix granuli TaxID=1499967 RepID=A0A081BY39_VECG1|nr:periplasmic binding protein/LacI transcriptional regulator [Candidatus Vecturithrix granuli]
MKKLLGALIIVAFVMAIGLPGTSLAADKIKIGISIPSADHGWTGGIVWWAQKAVEEWSQKDANLEFFVVTADSPAKQVGDVEDLMVKGIDALVILPHDSAPLTPVVEEVYNSGVYTVVVDRGLIKEAQHVYIAGDNPGLGRVSAEWMAKEMDGKGKIVVLEGIPCVINTERVEAFKAVMAKYPDIEIMDSQPAYWSTQKGLEIMENYLQKYDKIDAVWAQDDDVLKGVLQAYKESGRDDIKLFLGGAGAKDIVKMVMDGDPLVRADVTYPPSMVATAISLAVKGVKNIPLDGFYQMKIPSRVILASELIVPENAKDYYYPDSVF